MELFFNECKHLEKKLTLASGRRDMCTQPSRLLVLRAKQKKSKNSKSFAKNVGRRLCFDT